MIFKNQLSSLRSVIFAFLKKLTRMELYFLFILLSIATVALARFEVATTGKSSFRPISPLRSLKHLKIMPGRFIQMIRYSGGFEAPRKVDVDSYEQFEAILASPNHLEQLLVIDFSAAWCMPCKIISPVFQTLSESEEFSDVVFLKVGFGLLFYPILL